MLQLKNAMYAAITWAQKNFTLTLLRRCRQASNIHLTRRLAGIFQEYFIIYYGIFSLDYSLVARVDFSLIINTTMTSAIIFTPPRHFTYAPLTTCAHAAYCGDLSRF